MPITNKKAHDAIIKARTQLVVREPFFGTLALQLTIVEVNDPRIDTMAVDGVNLYYSPAFVLTLSEEELVGVIAHEVEHCAYSHFSRRGHRNHRKFNIAGDFRINWDIREAGFTLPWKGITLAEAMAGGKGHMYDPQFKAMSTEEIYEKIPDPPPQPSGGEGSSDPGGCGGVMDAGTGPGDPDQPADQRLSPEQVAHEWQANVRMAVSVARANNAGRTPGYLERLVGQLKKPKVSWRDLTTQFIDQSFTVDYSYRRPNRRYAHAGLILPGTVPDALQKLVMFIDCSGSITNEMLHSYVSEVSGALNTGVCDHLIVVYADDKVQRVDEFYPGDVVTAKAVDGGGTDFADSFDWLAKNAADAACAIYLTDMETCSFGKDPGLPVMWAAYSTEERLASIKPPFGQTILVDSPH